MIMKQTLFFLFLSIQLFAQKTNSLPRSTPEAEGVSSEAITQFLDIASKSQHEFHSFMLVRHGKVIAESWWNPYKNDLKHTMYSCSKSFTATAVGFAVAEKKLTVDDKVISFFPNDLPDTISPNLAELRVKDLLSMSVGQAKDATGPVVVTDDWVKAFFKQPIAYLPGTKFLYNSAATYMLSAIVQKVIGEKVIDYLKPRLFNPLGIEGIDWEVSPQGINTGGWGLRLKTEDMAKFGQLFLQKGMWNGQQVLPAAWVEEASTIKIMQNPDASQTQKDSSDWLQGYCYQMWRSRHNSFRGDGANGQFILVLPDQDAVIITTAEAPDMQGEINLIWQYIFPALQASKLPDNPTALANLQAKSAALALPPPSKNVISPLESTISGKNFSINNDKTLQNISFYFNTGICQLTIKTDSAKYQIPFGLGNWAMSETTKYGPYLVAAAKSNRTGLAAFKTAGSYTWKDEKTLELTLRYIESPHTETINCIFEGDTVSVDFVSIFNKNQKRTVLKGVK